MIEPDFDVNGRWIGVSLVQPLSEAETKAMKRALQYWKAPPVVWAHNPPMVEVIQLRGRWEPEIEDEP